MLLCTFSLVDDTNLVLDYIITKCIVRNNCIFSYYQTENPKKQMFLYNVDDRAVTLEQTITVHRKSDTNTIYTINALNRMIAETNNGVITETYEIDWNRYMNKLLTTNNRSYTSVGITFNEKIFL